jgi:hypothetical protein
VGAPTVVLASGTALAAKGPALALAIAQLRWSPADLRRLARGGSCVLVFIIACCVVNLLIPNAWQAALGTRAGVSYRAVIPSLIGPFSHPGELGPMAAFGFLAVVAWNTALGGTRSTRLLAAGTAVTAVLSFRRKTWLGLAAGYLWLSARTRRPAVFVAAVLSVVGVVTVFAAELGRAFSSLWSTYVVQANGTAARSVMTRDSWSVALDHFPLGAGFGRFGSVIAGTHYSPEYLARGYDKIWGLSASLGNDRYLTDTMWPAILGEAGFFGLLMFLFALFAIYRRLRVVASGDVPIVRWLGLTGLGWLLQYLVESSGTPVFVAPPLYVPLFALVGISASFSVSGGVEPGPLAGPGGVVQGARERAAVGPSVAEVVHPGSAAAGSRSAKVQTGIGSA